MNVLTLNETSKGKPVKEKIIKNNINLLENSKTHRNEQGKWVTNER